MREPEVRLQRFTEADVDDVLAWMSSARFLYQWAGPMFRFPLERAQLARHVRDAGRKRRPRKIFKVVDGVVGRNIGHVELCNIDRANGCARLARVLIGPRELRGCGLGADVVRLALGVAFDELRLHRVSLGVFDFNHAAIRCYERVGLRTEGLLREACCFAGEYWNLVQMGILEPEWRAREDHAALPQAVENPSLRAVEAGAARHSGLPKA